MGKEKGLRGDGVAALAADTHVHLPCPPSTRLHCGAVSIHGAIELCTRRGWIGAQLSRAGRLTCSRGGRGTSHMQKTRQVVGHTLSAAHCSPPQPCPAPRTTHDARIHGYRRCRRAMGAGWDGALCGRARDGGAAATAWTRDGAEGRKRRRARNGREGVTERREGVTERRRGRRGTEGMDAGGGRDVWERMGDRCVVVIERGGARH